MSDSFDVKYFNGAIGTLGTAVSTIKPLFKNHSKNGAITILEVNHTADVAGTAVSYLVYYSGTDTSGSGVKGTIANLGTVPTAYAEVTGTLTSAVVVPANSWVAWQTTLGTTAAGCAVNIAYVNGR